MTYFDARELPAPTDEYVAWIDVMGIQSHMSRSINVAANFMGKLHVAVLDAPLDGVSLYPIMDGLYATSPSRKALEDFLRHILTALAKLFVSEKHCHFQFIVRGAIAYGQIYHGRNIGDAASKRLAEKPGYRASLLLGEPIIHSNQGERNAPPFGVFIHETARTSDDGEWWRWFNGQIDPAELMQRLREHYDWCLKKDSTYAPERLKAHLDLATKFLT